MKKQRVQELKKGFFTFIVVAISFTFEVNIFYSRVISKLLRTVKNQYYILKGHGLATSDIHEEFENLQQHIEGKTGVCIPKDRPFSFN